MLLHQAAQVFIKIQNYMKNQQKISLQKEHVFSIQKFHLKHKISQFAAKLCQMFC